MSNQDNKLTDTLDKLDHYIKQLWERIKSKNTKAHDGPVNMNVITIRLALEMTMG